MAASENRKNASVSLSLGPFNRGDDICDVREPLQRLQSVHPPSSPTYQYYRSIFDRADRDHDGYITLQELENMIDDNELSEEPLDPDLVRRIHRMSDRNQDGRLNYEEFVAMLKDPKYRSLFGRYINRYINFIVPRKKLGAQFQDETDNLYEDEYSCWPPKLGMIIISIIEVVFFMIDEITIKNSTNSASGPMAVALIYDPTRRYEAWRYLTYMFVHIGYFFNFLLSMQPNIQSSPVLSVHLTVNLMVQIAIGIPLEMVHGWWRVLATYSAGVVAGSLSTSIADPTSKLAGASGGVYSLITAHIAAIVMNWSNMSFPAVQLILFLLVTGIDVGTSIYNRYAEPNVDDHIGYVAHFGGAVAGLLVGIVILRNLKLTKKENVIWWLAVAIYVILMLVALCWNIFYPSYFPKKF